MTSLWAAPLFVPAFFANSVVLLDACSSGHGSPCRQPFPVAATIRLSRGGSEGKQEAVPHQLADHVGTSGTERGFVLAEEGRERAQDLPDRALAVAGADQAALHRVDLPGPPHAALLPEHDGLRVGRARLPRRLLAYVDPGAQPRGQQGVVIH